MACSLQQAWPLADSAAVMQRYRAARSPSMQHVLEQRQFQRSLQQRHQQSSSGSSGSSGSRAPRHVRMAAVADEEDLWQYPDREQWYLAKFCAIDQPDWNPARIVRSTQLAPGIREVVLEVEISREKIPLRNAYKHIGQTALVRVNSGMEQQAVVAAPPFPQALNTEALLSVRGDMSANEIKKAKEDISVMAELPLFVREDEQPELYKLTDEDMIELGPFQGAGLDLRGPIAAIFMYPTIVVFAEGYGIATAKALIEAGPDVGGLNFRMRPDVRMYYRAPNEAALCYKDLFESWAKDYGVKVITSTRDSFSDMFDDDDTLMYEPETTAAIVLTGGDEEEEALAAEVCKDADITQVVRQSVEQVPTEYLVYGKPKE